MRTKLGALAVATAALAGGVLTQTDQAEAATPDVVVDSLSVVSAPNGQSKATATVHGVKTIKLQALTVAVRSADGANRDFPGAVATTLGTRSTTFTSGSRAFPAGTYTYYVAYKFHDHWHSLSPVKSFTAGAGTGTAAPAPTASAPSGTATPTPSTPAPTATASTPGSAVPSSAPSSSAPSSTGAAPVGIPGTWHPVFADEFNGGALDASKWNANWFGCPTCVTKPPNSAEGSAYSPSQVTVGDGSLHLKLAQQPTTVGGKTYPYVSGLVTSNGKAQFTYGAFEARIYTPSSGSQMANWPSFWADGQNWPTDGELDVLEGLGGSACYHFHSPAGGPGGCASGTYSGGWHTFGADWKQGSVTYYYDGKQVGQITSGITSAPMYLILNNAVNPSHSGTNVAPADMQVDYVRVWQH
ncbi:glycoside hydrolase family 16 protein [Streptomyces sp. NPDC051997]|uniref:glycoside hydrolase family 16 protein n=1 Tax=Streptomyces sp. NPDC051997 TaxID=3155611 RepID=UPI00343EB7FF